MTISSVKGYDQYKSTQDIKTTQACISIKQVYQACENVNNKSMQDI